MHNRAVILTAVLFVLIVVGMLVFAYLKKQEQTQSVAQVVVGQSIL